QQPQVEPADVDQQTFEYVLVPAKVGSAHAAGLQFVGEGTLDQLPALPQQPLATRAANPSAVAVHRVTRFGLAFPVTPAALRLADIAADADLGAGFHHLVAVVALVGDHLLNRVDLDLSSRRFTFTRCVQVLAALFDRLPPR